MNWPFLIEPYNAWQKHPKRKKHWMEIAEEEALFVRMMQEARDQQSSQQVQDGNTANAAAAAGAGGVLFPYIYAEREEQANFSISKDTVSGPLTLSFTNLTTTPEDDTFLWDFGDGTTSTDITPSPKFYDTGSYDIVLQETSSAGNMTAKTLSFSASSPTIIPSFTPSVTTGISDLSVSFTNTTTADSNFALSYLWTFDTASTPTASTAINPTAVFATGSHTVRMSVTGAFYNIAFSTSSINLISASFPVVSAGFTGTPLLGIADLSVSLVNSTTTDAVTSIPMTYLWTFDTASAPTASAIRSPIVVFGTGSHTIRMSATTSYDAASSLTRTNYVSASMPTLVADFTSSARYGLVPLPVTFSNLTTYDGVPSSPLTYRWEFGSSSLTSITQSAATCSYTTGSIFDVTLQVTGAYDLMSSKTVTGYISSSEPQHA